MKGAAEWGVKIFAEIGGGDKDYFPNQTYGEMDKDLVPFIRAVQADAIRSAAEKCAELAASADKAGFDGLYSGARECEAAILSLLPEVL